MRQRIKLISRKLEQVFVGVNCKIFVREALLHYGMSVQIFPLSSRLHFQLFLSVIALRINVEAYIAQ